MSTSRRARHPRGSGATSLEPRPEPVAALLAARRDTVHRHDFVQRSRSLGIQTLLSPVRASRANAVAERVIRTLRDECLDHLIIFNEWHLRLVLAEFVEYYHTERPHRSLLLDTPRPAVRPAAGSVHPRPVLGGLHRIYERAG